MIQIKKYKLLILLLLISVIPLFDFLKPGLPVTHDGQDHVARIANFYQSLKEGNLVPRWAENLNWGYGHPILMFLYPLPSYIASFFKFAGFSFVDSVKITYALSFILSGIFMFLWIRELWGDKAGFVSGVIYLFAPYRFVDLYVRGAIGESWAFVWPPLICFFILRIARERRVEYLLGGSLALAALILSHNALMLMFLPVILGYAFYSIYSSKNRRSNAIFLLLLFVFGFLLAAFFWIPAFFEGKYTLRDIVTKDNIIGFENIGRLLWSPWSYLGTGAFSVQIGIVQWLGVLFVPLAIVLAKRQKENIWTFLFFLLLTFCIAILMILPISKPLYLSLSLLQKFQFAWRFLFSSRKIKNIICSSFCCF